jgi:hypothetical protein
VRSPVILGIVFLATAGLCVAGVPREAVTPVVYAIAGVLGLAGVLIMMGLRAGYYAGLIAGAVTALSGVAAWVGLARWSLPMHPALSVVVGLYMCMRVATSQAMFRPRRPAMRSDEEAP